MTALTLLANPHEVRQRRDRLEILTALIEAPGFEEWLRPEVIDFPAQHPVYAWQCAVEDCQRPRSSMHDLCGSHYRQWQELRTAGGTRTAFVAAACGLPLVGRYAETMCLICGNRPAQRRANSPLLCHRHRVRWTRHRNAAGGDTDFQTWRAGESGFPGWGRCRALCANTAQGPLGLCPGHHTRYVRQGRPGGAVVPGGWARSRRPELVRPTIADGKAFDRWCRTDTPMFRPGQLSLIGLPALAAAELRWGLHQHAIGRDRARWLIGWLNQTVNVVRAAGVTSLMDLDTSAGPKHAHMVCQEIRAALGTIYLTVAETKAAGFIETDQFGRRFPRAVSRYDLTAVTQRWLRDMLWEHLVGRLKSPTCPRTRGAFDAMRRATIELSAWLSVTAPEGGHNPRLLDAADADAFVADQRHRGRQRLPALGVTLRGGKSAQATDYTVGGVINGLRALLGEALANGYATAIGLRRGFINAIPAGGTVKLAPRSPFSDEVAQALANEENLRVFAAKFDPNDRGLRDVWETLVLSGRRCSEVLGLRLDCIGHYSGLPMLWHDQTKVGNLGAGIRIPERLYQLLDRRRTTTLTRFEHRTGRPPTAAERAGLAMFPRWQRNQTGTQSLGYAIFCRAFRAWVDGLDIGGGVAHQARHTLATRLLRHGASLAHIRQYLGHVSEQMAEHYAHVSSADLDDVLARVWVAGPGADQPGIVLSTDPAGTARPDALVLAIDLSRRATPTDGGFCTYQPVVDGGACPWKLNCESCDKFVLSGADLVYWRRKREQWYSLAERAPDEATATYLHQVFAPTAAAIDGLEKALAAAGLLDQALAVDLRRPQDYFHRVWSTAFPATDLARIGATE